MSARPSGTWWLLAAMLLALAACASSNLARRVDAPSVVPTGSIEQEPSHAVEPAAGSPQAGAPRWPTWVATGVLGLFFGSQLRNGSEEAFEQTGNWLEYLLPVSAALTATGKRDRQGLIQFAKAFGVGFGTTQLMKATLDKQRPETQDSTSFPSGHTQSAWAGAAFLDQRYGHAYGIPAYLAAAYTSYSRIEAGKHFVDDIVAGASISLLSNWYFVDPLASNLSVRPLALDGGFGLSLSLVDGHSPTIREQLAASAVIIPRKPFYFELQLGPSVVQRSVVSGPHSSDGNEVPGDAISAEGTSVSAFAAFHWRLTPHGALSFLLMPSEVRDTRVTSGDVTLGGTSFPDGTMLASEYLLTQFRVRYAQDLLPDPKAAVRLGGGLTFLDTSASLFEVDDTGEEIGDSGVELTWFDVLPTLHLGLGYTIGERWHTSAELDYGFNGSDRFAEGALGFKYQLDAQWDIGLGYRYFTRELDTDRLTDSLGLHRILMAFGYAF